MVCQELQASGIGLAELDGDGGQALLGPLQGDPRLFPFVLEDFLGRVVLELRVTFELLGLLFPVPLDRCRKTLCLSIELRSLGDGLSISFLDHRGVFAAEGIGLAGVGLFQGGDCRVCVLPRGHCLLFMFGGDLLLQLASCDGSLAESKKLFSQQVAVVGGVGHCSGPSTVWD